jgi:hypothetical protein
MKQYNTQQAITNRGKKRVMVMDRGISKKDDDDEGKITALQFKNKRVEIPKAASIFVCY